MTKRMLIDAAHADETRVVIADNHHILDFDFVTSSKKQVKGNIYLAKITRVEPSLQAAFVEYGAGKQGFLPFAEIHPDYYQIPIADREKLMEEVMAESNLDDDLDDDFDREPAAASDAPNPSFPEASYAPDAPLPETPATDLNTVEAQGDRFADAGGQALPNFLERAIGEPAEDALLADAEAHMPHPAALAPEPQADANTASAAALASDTAYTATTEGFSADSQAEPMNEPAPENADDNVETLNQAEQEEESAQKRSRSPFSRLTRRYRIQEVIKRGQIVLVQVIKEERGNKGASLSAYISLAGRYCVLMPNSPKDGGISRKINSSEDRRRLRQISAELRLSAGMSAIIRTAGMDRSHAEIKRDFDYLVKVWNDIRDRTLNSTAPALIYEESDVMKRSLRDLYNSDMQEVVVEGEAAWHAAREFMEMMMPSQTPKVRLHRDRTPLFYAYGVEDQLMAMHDPIVKLRSGGYIVLSPTEALISIDVNSGRATGERNIEETAAKTNLEAAAEIARQLRLRDLAGLIVIDFIDMMDSRNRRAVERALKDALRQDRAKIQLGRISPFGLLEMSRQRLRPSISESSTMQCPHCQGRGIVRSQESIGIQIIRALEKEASLGNASEIRVLTSAENAASLFNLRRADIAAIEQNFGVRILLDVQEGLLAEGFKIERVKGEGRRNPRNRRGGRGDRDDAPTPITHGAPDAPLEIIDERDDAPDNITVLEDESGEPRPRRGRDRSRRRGGRDRNRRGERPGFNAESGEVSATAEREENDTEATPSNVGNGEHHEQPAREGRRDRGDRPRRERGGRGRKRWRDRPEDGSAPAAAEAVSNQPTALPPVWEAPISTYHEPTRGPSYAPAEPVAAPAYSGPVVANRARDLEAETRAVASLLEEQKAQDGARRGWWRKLVE